MMDKSIVNMTRFYWLIFINVILMVFILFVNKKVNFGSITLSSSVVNDCHPTLSLNIEKSPSDSCKWKFHHYSPSPWESFWYDNISTLQNLVCETLVQEDQSNKSATALIYIRQLHKTIYHHSSPSNPHDALFSKLYYQYECPGQNQLNPIVSQYIEPLIGLLRDPLQICSFDGRYPGLALEGMESLQSKYFILLGPSAPYQHFRTSTSLIAPWLYRRGSQKILFDIGSSYFNGLHNTPQMAAVIGTRWFYEYFHQVSLQFDRIICFEATEYSPKTYWDQIPDDLIGRLTFINKGVETTGKFNPWNILKSIAKEDDYVMIKLDIDLSLLEAEFINQILNDTSISVLIDEMFFEMHVTVKEMVPSWLTPPGTLQDSYVVFTKLRQLGIRMHSWP